MSLSRILAIVTLTSLSLASGATARKPQPAKPAADYFPLRVGDSWTYGNVGNDSEYTLKVVAEEPSAGNATRYQIELRAGVIVHKFFSKEDGWVLHWADRYPEHEGLEAKYEPPKKYLPIPLKPGSKWSWQGKDYTQTVVSEKHEVIGFETVTVPAGKFRAMKVVSEITGGAAVMTKTYWYAEGVGMVKTTTVGGEIKYGSELIDYSFKKKPK